MADPGFLREHQPRIGGVNSQYGYKLYVKTKESEPLGGGACWLRPLGSANADILQCVLKKFAHSYRKDNTDPKDFIVPNHWSFIRKTLLGDKPKSEPANSLEIQRNALKCTHFTKRCVFQVHFT